MMIPRLGDKYHIEIETISKLRAGYSTAEYLEKGSPKAPAIMVGNEIVVQGADISDENLETVICEQLGVSLHYSPLPPVTPRLVLGLLE